MNSIMPNAKLLPLGCDVIGIDGLTEHTGVVKEVTYNEHRVLGNFWQVWVEWDYNPGHLEPFFPRQFTNYTGQTQIGVYIAQPNAAAVR